MLVLFLSCIAIFFAIIFCFALYYCCNDSLLSLSLSSYLFVLVFFPPSSLFFSLLPSFFFPSYFLTLPYCFTFPTLTAPHSLLYLSCFLYFHLR